MIRDETEAREYVDKLCDKEAMERLDTFVAALREENSRQNLVAKPTLDIAWQRHIADSAQLLECVSRGTSARAAETGLWLDLGTGAGLPGLIIAIMRPQRPVMLVESRRKRIDWLERMRMELAIPKCEVAGSRLELVETVPASVISARAFAPLPSILDLSARFSTGQTMFVLPKGRSAAQELDGMPRKVRKMFHVERSVTDDDAGILVGKLAKGMRGKT
ncbi:16S rRNA (guanine(527)-N(7))-methyltransferase RsmG [Pontixanthobacter aestiaquae]|uniref:Ribosomal RNA small subunit methyltransferase G n=1 Tax=Pontixanthobacter aestiaquae TaxID=1509367 RepID=A0A844Z061_9SPHN|nr:16S rRNA (guanine(527)-N(7))-methyltransferase RsmG [Pontixanthobacter aestiaquae]MDN3646897.1 16S rRNA (guanine(527)-N(7))-methyltransferase RsmG [Pontixanthobacter aestiaquae]MXO82121.1 16S rRNA (guanine(527)-N(7))-methyltransferase RsmG [Pontixanthobacter aestiaquae]